MRLAHHVDVLRQANWRKSSYSASNYQCVEVAVTAQAVGVRDTKDREGGTLAFDRRQWSAFLGALRTP